MRISAALPHGVTALLFEAASRRRELETRLVGLLEAQGFGEVVLPILDYLEPYEAVLTPEARGELYQLIDRDGEVLALRADFTPMLARMLAPRVDSLELPTKAFYRGDVVRFQEERAGRLREFYQLGAELLGVPGPEADEEILALFLELVTAGHERTVDVVLGDARALERPFTAFAGRHRRGGDDAQTVEAVAAARELAAALARRDREALRAAGLPELLEIAERGVPDDPQGALGAEAAAGLERLHALAGRLGERFPRARLVVDLAEFAPLAPPSGAAGRGLAGGIETEATWERSYYDGPVFRAYLGPSALPVGGGGRYDRLFRLLGADLPAVGFSLGLDRLIEGIDGRRRPR